MSNQTKQTAVEWLVEHFQKLQKEGEKMSWQQIIDITKLSKEMEKEQIIKSYNEDLYGGLSNHKKFDDGENYYNETYGGNK